MSEKVKFEQRDTLKENQKESWIWAIFYYMLSVDYDEEKAVGKN